jgi:hypothetical protein
MGGMGGGRKRGERRIVSHGERGEHGGKRGKVEQKDAKKGEGLTSRRRGAKGRGENHGWTARPPSNRR